MLFLGLPETFLIVLRGGVEEFLAHVIVVALPHLQGGLLSETCQD